MSWFDRSPRIAMAAAVALLGGACIQPLYGQRGATGGVSPVAASLAAIEIEPATNRVDQQLRNSLIFAFTGGGAAPAPMYRLKISASESVQSAVVDPFTSRPTTETYALNTTFTLTEMGPGGKNIFTGRAFGRASYDRSRQRFASLRARRDAEDRAADVVAQQITTQLGGLFATRR